MDGTTRRTRSAEKDPVVGLAIELVFGPIWMQDPETSDVILVSAGVLGQTLSDLARLSRPYKHVPGRRLLDSSRTVYPTVSRPTRHMVSVGHMPKYAAWGRAYLIAPNAATRVLHIEKYHNANQPFGGCLVSDWDLSVKKGKRCVGGRAVTFMLSVSTALPKQPNSVLQNDSNSISHR